MSHLPAQTARTTLRGGEGRDYHGGDRCPGSSVITAGLPGRFSRAEPPLHESVRCWWLDPVLRPRPTAGGPQGVVAVGLSRSSPARCPKWRRPAALLPDVVQGPTTPTAAFVATIPQDWRPGRRALTAHDRAARAAGRMATACRTRRRRDHDVGQTCRVLPGRRAQASQLLRDQPGRLPAHGRRGRRPAPGPPCLRCCIAPPTRSPPWGVRRRRRATGGGPWPNTTVRPGGALGSS